MRYVLENDTLRVEIDSFGAELKSVKRKSDGKEYMWYADKKYWGRTSPVLFPFVGNCRNKEYRYGGKTYAMGQHGFARDMNIPWNPRQRTPSGFPYIPMRKRWKSIHSRLF